VGNLEKEYHKIASQHIEKEELINFEEAKKRKPKIF
jgi:hypothetical protein